MRFKPEHKRQTHARIVRNASVQMRKMGPSALSVHDLMRAAGLTHGGFYLHFQSREALVGEALAFAMDQTIARWTTLMEGRSPDEGIAAVIDTYLDRRHCANPGDGCALPAFGAEIGRTSRATRRLFSMKLEELIGVFACPIEGETATLAIQRATAAIATLVGTVILARATESKHLSDRILKAGRSRLFSSVVRRKSERGRSASRKVRGPS
jgi:TetR/AcrR family transcriptional repressor of nem operon